MKGPDQLTQRRQAAKKAGEEQRTQSLFSLTSCLPLRLRALARVPPVYHSPMTDSPARTRLDPFYAAVEAGVGHLGCGNLLLAAARA